MIVTKDNERLYLKSWSYNSARLLTQLAKIVIENGGKVKPLHPAIISNRTREDAIQEYQDKIALYTELEKEISNPLRSKAIQEYTAKLAKLTAVNNDPITVTHTTYISFVLNGIYYYYQTDDNPFFPFHYQKTQVINGKYARNARLVEDDKAWLYDNFFYCDCTDADIAEAANKIYNMLVNAPCTRILRVTRQERIPNANGSGYHYKTVDISAILETIDF